MDRLPPLLAVELARQYDVLRMLGQGGMGTVWLARGSDCAPLRCRVELCATVLLAYSSCASLQAGGTAGWPHA